MIGAKCQRLYRCLRGPAMIYPMGLVVMLIDKPGKWNLIKAISKLQRGPASWIFHIAVIKIASRDPKSRDPGHFSYPEIMGFRGTIPGISGLIFFILQ